MSDFLYFNDDGKIGLFYIEKKYFLWKKEMLMFFSLNELN